MALSRPIRRTYASVDGYAWFFCAEESLIDGSPFRYQDGISGVACELADVDNPFCVEERLKHSRKVLSGYRKVHSEFLLAFSCTDVMYVARLLKLSEKGRDRTGAFSSDDVLFHLHGIVYALCVFLRRLSFQRFSFGL